MDIEQTLMGKNSAKSVSMDEQNQRREMAVRLRLNKMKINDIASECKLSRTTVIAVCKAYKAGGLDNVKLKPRGRPCGSGRKMTEAQEAGVWKLICDNTPDELGMPFILWKRTTVKQLIRERFGVMLSTRAVGNYLGRWRLTPRRPPNYDPEPKSLSLQQWLDKKYPGIEAQAKRENAEIHWLCETEVPRHHAQLMFSGLAGGDEESLRANLSNRLTLLTTVANRGTVRWKIHKGAMNAERLTDFFKRLNQDVGHKVFLILNDSKSNQTVRVESWLKKNKEKVAIFRLPENESLSDDSIFDLGELYAGMQ